jgi:hypothetical protein
MNARRSDQHAVEIEQNRIVVPRGERGDDFHMASCLAIERASLIVGFIGLMAIGGVRSNSILAHSARNAPFDHNYLQSVVHAEARDDGIN